MIDGMQEQMEYIVSRDSETHKWVGENERSDRQKENSKIEEKGKVEWNEMETYI